MKTIPISNQARGFTLVEMLVVIAIIAILASMLAPSLQNAIESSRTIVCINNEKQIHLLLTQYENDFNGHIVPLEYGSLEETFTHILANNGYLEVSNTSLSQPIGKETTVFTCPSGIPKILSANPASRYDEMGARCWRQASTSTGIVVDCYYSLNSSTWDKNYMTLRVPLDGTGEVIVRKKNSLKKPGKFVMMLDGFYTNFNSRPARLNARHNNKTKTNVLFLDGSARSTDILDIPEVFWISNLNNNYPDTVWRVDQ